MSNPKATIDRFEGDLAVLIVDGVEQLRARSELPEGAREGDVLDLDTLQLDPEARDALSERVRAARAGASAKKSSGSFDL